MLEGKIDTLRFEEVKKKLAKQQK